MPVLWTDIHPSVPLDSAVDLTITEECAIQVNIFWLLSYFGNVCVCVCVCVTSLLSTMTSDKVMSLLGDYTNSKSG